MRHLHHDIHGMDADDLLGEINDQMLAEAAQVDLDIHLTNYDYDVPYLAGCSTGGVPIYLDRGLKSQSLSYKGATRPVVGDLDRGIIIHESLEKARMDAWQEVINNRFSISQANGHKPGRLLYSVEQRARDLKRMYIHAHQYAERIEREVVRVVLGLPWEVYDAFWRPLITAAEHERLRSCPPDLDLRPYEFEDDVRTLQGIADAGGSVSPMLGA